MKASGVGRAGEGGGGGGGCMGKRRQLKKGEKQLDGAPATC